MKISKLEKKALTGLGIGFSIIGIGALAKNNKYLLATGGAITAISFLTYNLSFMFDKNKNYQ